MTPQKQSPSSRRTVSSRLTTAILLLLLLTQRCCCCHAFQNVVLHIHHRRAYYRHGRRQSPTICPKPADNNIGVVVPLNARPPRDRGGGGGRRRGRGRPMPRNNSWEGDDIRWLSRLARRLFRRNSSSSIQQQQQQPCRNTLLFLNVAMFVYQTVTTVHWIRRKHPEYWPNQAASIVWDVIWGTSVTGPLILDFATTTAATNVRRQRSGFLSQQPHRFLTGGFLHGGLLHLLLNLDSLRRLPPWLETGLGSGLYATAYLVAIVAGNFCQYHMDDAAGSSFCLGASGGICGLYGLLFVSLVRMGNSQAASRVLRGVGWIVLYGLLFVPHSISNAAHVGGFVGGLVVALLFGPRYNTKSYAMRRKWSLEADVYSRDYRQAMGFATKPQPSLLPLPFFWLVTGILLVAIPQLRSMPQLVWQGLVRPGSVHAGLLF